MACTTRMGLTVRLLMGGAALALLGTACGSSTSSPSPSASQQESSPTAVATLSASSSASAAPTSVDPCALVTAQEASQLSGATFGSGTEGSTSGGAKTCVYGSQTLNVFNVLVSQASDAATAQAAWTQEQANAQAELQKAFPQGVTANLNVTDTTIAGADKAATATFSTTISGQTVSISAVYVLKGATFFTFSDLVLGRAAPAVAAMQAQAETSLGRV